MPDFAVSTAFTSQDRVSSAFRNMGRNAGRFGNSASSAFQRAGRSGSRFGDIVKGILSAEAIKRGLGLLKQGLSAAATEFISFDDAATSAVSKFNEINLATEQGQKSFASLKAAARETGANTEKTAAESAQALDLLALSGFNLEQSIANLPGVVDLSTASQLDMARSTEIATQALGAYGLKVKDSGQLQKNFTRTTDLLVATSTSSETTLENLFEAVASGAGTFVGAGQDIETFNALVGKLAGRAVLGEKAGTALRNIVIQLAAPAAAGQKALDKLEVTIDNGKGSFRDIIDVVEDFEVGLKKYGEVATTAAIKTIFGKKSIDAFQKLILIGSKELRSYRGELFQVGGRTKQIADVMRDSLGNRIRVLASSAIEMGFRFLEAFDGKGRKGITILTEAVRNFDMQPVVDAVKSTIDIVKDLFQFIEPVVDIISSLNKSDVKGILAIAAAFKAISLGVNLVSLAMAANPIGLVVAGISLVGSALILLQNKFNIFGKLLTGIENFVLSTNKDLQIIFSHVGDFFGDIFDGIIRKFGFVRDAIDIAQRAGSAIGDFFGFGDERESSAQTPSREIIPPNREEIQLRRQEINFNGQLNIAGAPPGSTFNGDTSGAPEIDVNLLGANP